MIVGNGQLAKIFSSYNSKDVCIFASGVSNSRCKDNKEFWREADLLMETIKQNPEKIMIYFSSCALSAPEYDLNEYYLHKLNMENLIKNNVKKYFIFRVPQLFGELKEHTTIINYLYFSILHKKKITLYDDAYRYVLDIRDLKKIVKAILSNASPNITIDLANPYRYSIKEIVSICEKILNQSANAEVIQHVDKYLLNLDEMDKFLDEHQVKLGFSEKYLEEKLSDYHERLSQQLSENKDKGKDIVLTD